MRSLSQVAFLRGAIAAGLVLFAAAAADAQVPAPVVEAAVPIIIGTLKPHKGPQAPRFEGTVINATVAQITVRAKGDDMGIQTFPLSEAASAKMLEIIEKGGYQYGDKVTVFYDPDSKKALKVKGKPSKAS
jgi:ABC-type transport system substrate-binding protein